MKAPRIVSAGLGIWLVASILLGLTGKLATAPRPLIPAGIVTATILLCAQATWPAPVRAWLGTLAIEALVALHATRFVGIYFLHLCARGRLAHEFALPAGWGDIAAAALACLVVLVPVAAGTRRRAIFWWNVAAFADLVTVAFTAARLGLARHPLMEPLFELPLSLLPTFLLPLLFASHVLIHLRLRSAQQAQAERNTSPPLR